MDVLLVATVAMIRGTSELFVSYRDARSGGIGADDVLRFAWRVGIGAVVMAILHRLYLIVAVTMDR